MGVEQPDNFGRGTMRANENVSPKEVDVLSQVFQFRGRAE